MNIIVDTQTEMYVNVITYNVCGIALHTLFNRAGTAVVVFNEIFSTKRNISVPVGQNVVGQILNTS